MRRLTLHHFCMSNILERSSKHSRVIFHLGGHNFTTLKKLLQQKLNSKPLKVTRLNIVTRWSFQLLQNKNFWKKQLPKTSPLLVHCTSNLALCYSTNLFITALNFVSGETAILETEGSQGKKSWARNKARCFLLEPIHKVDVTIQSQLSNIT